MKKMTCILVDDNPLARAALRQLADHIESLDVVAEFENATDAYNFLQKQSVDALFLDIEMPDMTGLELLENLSERPPVVLCTSKTEYAAAAFELNVVDYLVKPVTLPRFIAAFEKLKSHGNVEEEPTKEVVKNMENIFIRANNAIIRLDLADIHYVQALGDYVTFVTTSKKYTAHLTMQNIEKALPTPQFVRVHRSYIVNTNRIDAIEEGTMLIINKQVVPLGEQYKSNLMKKLNLLK
jgi:two-component system, LytTR family, response regulator